VAASTAPQHFLFDLDLFALGLDAQAQAPEDAHVDIGHPDQREDCNQEATPVVEQQAVTREQHKKERDPVAQAVIARENVENLPLKEPLAILAALLAVFARFTGYLFVGNRPGDAGDWDRQSKARTVERQAASIWKVR
jgi:hypothetical protein